METNWYKTARQERRNLAKEAKADMGLRADKVTKISIFICIAVVLVGIVAAIFILRGVEFERSRQMTNALYGTVQGEVVFGVNLKNQVNSGKVTLTFDSEEYAAKEHSRLEKLTNDFYEEQSAEGEYPNYYENMVLKGRTITFELTEAYLDIFMEDRVYSDAEVEALCDQIANVVLIYDRAGATWTFRNVGGNSTVTGLVSCTMTYELGADMLVTDIRVNYVFEDSQGVSEMKAIVEDESDQYYANHLSYATMLGLVDSADDVFEEYKNMQETDTTLYYEYSDIYIKLYNMTGGCMEDALRGFILAGGEWEWIE